jgi:hypothetical protein
MTPLTGALTAVDAECDRDLKVGVQRIVALQLVRNRDGCTEGLRRRREYEVEAIADVIGLAGLSWQRRPNQTLVHPHHSHRVRLAFVFYDPRVVTDIGHDMGSEALRHDAILPPVG